MKRAVWLVAGLLTAVLTIASILWVPQPNRLAAIPTHAHVVYNHEDADWFLAFFPMLGRDDSDFSTHWKKYFQGLEKRPLAVATVPFAGPGQRNTWVAVSELDGLSALALRWRLMLLPPEGVRSARPYAAWSVWRFEHEWLPSWATVRFALTENLLVCSVSADSGDIYRLLDVADGRAVSKKR